MREQKNRKDKKREHKHKINREVNIPQSRINHKSQEQTACFNKADKSDGYIMQRQNKKYIPDQNKHGV